MVAITKLVSQTDQVRERKSKGLHPVNELQRFGILVCCFFCSICVSLTFAFELLSTQFRSQFNLSAGDMSTISTVGLAVCYFSLPYSLIYENFGPTVNFLICGVTGFIGSLCLGLTFQNKMPGSLASITIFYALMNVTAGLFDVSYISSLFEIFPRNRGPVIGLAKVMTGLGASIFSCVCNTIFASDVASFVYFLSAFTVVVSVVAAVVVVLPPYHMNYWRRRGKTPEELQELDATRPYYNSKFVPKPRLLIGYTVVLVMIVFFAIEAPVIAYTSVSRGSEIAVGVIAIALVACLFIPMLPIPALGGMNERAPEEYLHLDMSNTSAGDTGKRGHSSPSALATAVAEGREDASGDALADDVVMSPSSPAANMDTAVKDSASQCASDDCDSTRDLVEHIDEAADSQQDPRYTATTYLDYFKAPELWLLLAYLFCAQPLGIMVSFNSSTISIALTGVERSEGLSALYSTLLGIGNSSGRLLFGLFEGYVQHQPPENRKVLVTVALFFVPVVGCIGGVFVHFLPGNAILFPFILIFIQTGFTSALAALMFTSLFEKFHNALYCTGCLTFVADVVLFNRALLGVWGDKEHARLGLPDSVECNKASCVRFPLIFVTCLCALSAGIAAVLHIRYSRFVRRVRRAARARRDADCGAVEEGANAWDDEEELGEAARSAAAPASRRDDDEGRRLEPVEDGNSES